MPKSTMLKLWTLSPYSPFLNPIEYAFNVLQNLVAKEEWYNRGELVRTIKAKIEEITPEKATGFVSRKTIESRDSATRDPN